MPTASSNVRVRGQSGKLMLVLSSSEFDPTRTLGRGVMGGPFRNSRVSRLTRGQPQHGAAEVIVLGEVAIDCNTVDLVVADDRLNELITAMRNVGNPAS